LRALHEPAPDEAPVNPFRGVPLAERDDVFHARFRLLRDRLGAGAGRIAEIWEDACAAPPARDRRWMHGDLHPRNVIVRDGAVAGLIDWGDLNAGDVANDLACAWFLIESPEIRREFLAAYEASHSLVRRALGWAVLVGLAFVESGEPRHVAIGSAALDRAVAFA
jgi:aminoglycoside phosphotransferase (APT) family kinase protein